METIIRAYTDNDKEVVLQLFDLNVPNYFSSEERPDLVYYLENEIEQYFVIEKDKQIVGCGGINLDSTKTKGVISWDIIHPAYQIKKLGTKLLKHRIELLKEMPIINSIIVRTSQHTYQFYQKQGFQLIETSKDFWAPGFDLYFMEYKSVTPI